METLKVFITLLALINPFGAIPMFLSLTAGQSARERHGTINTAAIATAIVIGVAALFGQGLLGVFGISIPSLQVGGGILLFILALNMFNAELDADTVRQARVDLAACFRMAGRISRFAGQTGLNIMTRLMGLVLAALAVEFVADGVRALAANGA